MKLDIDTIIDNTCQSYNIQYDKTLQGVFSSLLDDIDKFIRPNPVFIGVGGIPGVGKTEYCKKKFINDFFIIDPDYIRLFHPNYGNLNYDNVIQETNAFTTQICELLLQIMSSLSCNFVVECTFSNYVYWFQILNSHKRKFENYYRKLILLSAPIEVCYQSMCLRYNIEKKDLKNIIPRKADKAFLLDRAGKYKMSIHYYTSDLFDDVILLHKNTVDSDFLPVEYDDFYNYIN